LLQPRARTTPFSYSLAADVEYSVPSLLLAADRDLRWMAGSSAAGFAQVSYMN